MGEQTGEKERLLPHLMSTHQLVIEVMNFYELLHTDTDTVSAVIHTTGHIKPLHHGNLCPLSTLSPLLSNIAFIAQFFLLSVSDHDRHQSLTAAIFSIHCVCLFDLILIQIQY